MELHRALADAEPRATVVLSSSGSGRSLMNLWMLEAIMGRDHLERAYEEALAQRYLWHEFGDVHLVLPPDGSRA